MRPVKAPRERVPGRSPDRDRFPDRGSGDANGGSDYFFFLTELIVQKATPQLQIPSFARGGKESVR